MITPSVTVNKDIVAATQKDLKVIWNHLKKTLETCPNLLLILGLIFVNLLFRFRYILLFNFRERPVESMQVQPDFIKLFHCEYLKHQVIIHVIHIFISELVAAQFNILTYQLLALNNDVHFLQRIN